MGLVELARAAMPETLLAAASEPSLRKIIQSFGHTAHVGILDPEFMVTYIAKMARRTHRVPTRIGAKLEAYCSGLGKVLLASLPKDVRASYVAEGPFIALTDNTIVEAEALDHELERVAEQGFAIDDCELFDDLRCVAVPIVDWSGTVIAALSTSAPASQFPREDVPRVARLLSEHAAQICAKLYPASHPLQRAH